MMQCVEFLQLLLSAALLDGVTGLQTGIAGTRMAARTQVQSNLTEWAEAADLWRPWILETVHPEREKYEDEKLAVDSGVINALTIPPEGTRQSGSGKKKIAFLFMVMDKIHAPVIWTKFFANVASDTYSIYVHRAAGASAANEKLPLKYFGAKEVATVNSTWCALMGVEIAMLNAALHDPNNEQFVFVSHDAVPLKRYGYVYDRLMKTSQTSKFCFAQPARHEHAMVEQLANEVNKRCIFRDYYRSHDPRVMKHHEWIVLSRQHAHTVARQARYGIKYWAKTWRKAAPDLHTMAEGCSDESVPITTLLWEARHEGTNDTEADLQAMGVESKCTTYVQWYNCFQNTDLHVQGWGFLKSVRNRGEDLFRYVFDKKFDFVKDTKMNAFPMHHGVIELPLLRVLVNQGFMFGRKFLPEAVVKVNGTHNSTLKDILPSLWNEVDERQADLSQWKHLAGPGS